MTGKIVSINISKEKGTIKKPVPSAEISELGIVGDAHAGRWHRQISLLDAESVRAFEKKADRKIESGEFAENLLLEGIDLTAVAIFDRFSIGEVELEVTQIGKKCHGDGCAIYQAVGYCVMPREGLFARVIRGGEIKTGDDVTFSPRTLQIQIITLSDRAHAGDYEDRSGPRIQSFLNDFFNGKRWHPQINLEILPDEVPLLEKALTSSRDQGVDIVITTGGTGVGPRDIAPDVVLRLADKTVPGIMEAIRIKYGMEKPNVLLSRSVVGILGETIVYTLPGSVKAVNEYMTEILKTMEHMIAMLHGIGH